MAKCEMPKLMIDEGISHYKCPRKLFSFKLEEELEYGLHQAVVLSEFTGSDIHIFPEKSGQAVNACESKFIGNFRDIVFGFNQLAFNNINA